MKTSCLLPGAVALTLATGLFVFTAVGVSQGPQMDRPETDGARRSSSPTAFQAATQDKEDQDCADPQRRGQRGGQGRGQGTGRRGGQGAWSQRGGRAADSNRGPAHIAQTDVPAQPVDVILGRPTRSAVTLSVLAYSDMRGQVLYGTEKGQLTSQTPLTQFTNGEPTELVIGPLQPDTRYYYQLPYQATGSSGLVEGTFHTQRPPGSKFVFTVQADSHLDQNTSPEVYVSTVRNALADGPDFHVDLGDTFMTGKYEGDDPTELYLAQRYYFGLLCRSAPLFLVLGNHDGEPGGRGRPRTGAVSLRKKFFPNPEPDAFYTGNRGEEEGVGLLQDYFAWEWGDALFVVLDPFWYSGPKRGEKDANWNRTLGREQYRWLKKTLAASQARFKFMFIHHLVGGTDSNGRGGVEAAKYFEWGGHNLEGEYEFNAKRSGWELPIHQMLVENDVSVVFHGHDHFFAKQDLDGVVYQLVPQPAHARYGNLRTAAEYGYFAGDILGGSGHARVTVTPDKARIDYILSVLPRDETADRKKGIVAHTYVLDRGVADEREDRPAP